MRSLALAGLGVGFMMIGAGLFLVTLMKAKQASATPKKSEQRELEAQRNEKKKLRLASGIVVGFGVILLLIS